MPVPWELQRADDDELAVLATCWGAPTADVRDASRAWVQRLGDADAPGPRVVRLGDRWLTVLDAPGEVGARWRPRMVGLRGLLRPEAVVSRAARAELRRSGSGEVAAGAAPGELRRLGPEDDATVRALHAGVPADELAAASPLPSRALLAVGSFAGGELRGIAALVETPVGPPEVSVLVGARARGRGVGLAVEQGVLREAAGRWAWVQHRTVEPDLGSRALAARCGFRLVSVEHLVRPAA